MIFKFNNIEIDTVNFRLLVNGIETSVEPQVFNVIIYLVNNKHKIVSRDDLLENIWTGRIVSDTTINNHIKSARKALGDDGTKQQVIKTIHSRGYQFIAEMHDSNNTDKEISNNNKKSARIIVVISVFITLLVFISIFVFRQMQEPESNFNRQSSFDAIIPQTLAVLPFANTKPGTDSDYLGFALANQIIGDLVYLDKFIIRPAGSIRKYIHQVIDPIQVGHDLNVNYVLNGNYLKENNVIRLNVELINVKSNEIIWRESMHVDYSDSFTLQDLVAQRVATGLNASFTSKGINRKYRDIPNSALAYEYYLRGISYPFSNEGHKLAVEMLGKSIELDPNYAPAYAHLGNHRRLLEQHGRIVPTGLHGAEWYYNKALDLNPELLEALSNLSGLYTETNRIEKALIITRKMLDINPNSADSHFALGYIYRYAGMLDEAIQEMELALTISPNNIKYRSIISTYVSAGKYKQALAKIYLDDGDYGIGYSGIIAFNQENYSLALEHFNKVIAIDANGIWGLIAQVYIALINNDKPTGLIALNKMVDTGIVDAENLFYFANFYALLGEQELSLKTLKKAVDMGYFNYPHISNSTAFYGYNQDEKYIQILKKAKQRHKAFRKNYL